MQRGSLLMLVVLYAAGFIAAFNENTVNVVLVDIMSQFGVASGTAQWLVTGYMVITSIIVAIMAFLQRRFGVRELLVFGSSCMVVGAVGGFVAPNFPLLLACRLLMAIGSGVFIPSMMTNVLALAPRQKMGTYLSIGSCCITFGPAFAPVVSGFMATTFGWRFIFVVPGVAALVVAVAAFLAVRNLGETSQPTLDLPSVGSAALGLTFLVFGLNELTSDVLVGGLALVVGLALLAFFVLRQTKLEDPILNLTPFQEKGFLAACLLSMVSMMTTFSMSVILMLYFEGALGLSAFVSGALLLIPILFNSAMAVFAGRIMDDRGPWPLIPAGFLVIVVGQLAVAFFGFGAFLVPVVIASVVTYAGVGLVMAPSQTAGLALVRRELHGSGVSVINLFIQVAACLGPALFTGVMATVSTADTATVGASLAQAHGFSYAVLIAAVIALVAAVTAVPFARRKPVQPKHAQADVPLDEFVFSKVYKTQVHVVPETATVGQAIGVLLQTHTGSMPIVDRRGGVVGFISDGDLVRYLTGGEVHAPLNGAEALYSALRDESVAENVPELLARNVMELATHNVIAVDRNSSLEDVCRVLSSTKVKKVPVLDHGKLVGTFSRSDLLRFFLASQTARASRAHTTAGAARTAATGIQNA